MSECFKIEFEWLHREHGDAAERATLADLSITVDGYLVTEVEDLLAKTVRKSARLSALYLAQWLAANWWRLRWEPEWSTPSWRMSHKIGAAGGGYVWPDLAFCSDGETILVHSRPTPIWEAQPIRYLNHFDVVISASDFEKGIDKFIEAATARLSSDRRNETDLAVLWKWVLDERRDPQAAKWRKLEAFMGFDPDEAPDGLVETLQSEAASYGESAVEEMAAASKDKAPFHIRTLWNDARRNGILARVSDFDRLRRRINDEIAHSELPWQRAAQAAQIAREVWSLGRGPVQTEALSDLFEVEVSQFSAQEPNGTIDIPLSAGFRDGGAAGEFCVFWNKRHPTARRFALARLGADHLVSREEERLLPATNAKTSRQKFQRAFAQEFLCPFDDLRDFLGMGQPSDDDIEDAAEHFDVSPLLIKTALVNKGVLEREALGD